MPSSTPATDPFLTLQSITKLQEFNLEKVFFSHGRTNGRASEIIQRFADNTRQCTEVALNALKSGETDKKIAHKLVDILAKHSTKARDDFLAWPYLIPTMVEGYRQYYNRSK